MMAIYDHHIHMDARNANDYEWMALCGVQAMVAPCSFSGEKRCSGESFAARFSRLTQFERVRASHFGIRLHAALAVHAADIGSERGATEGLDVMARFLEEEKVVAVGELAFRSFNALEVDVFSNQLVLAKQHGMPVMVEAPQGINATRKLLKHLDKFLSKGLIEPQRVCVVDLNLAKFELLKPLRLGAYGFAVSPKVDGIFAVHEKLTPDQVKEVLAISEDQVVMLNSGLHFGFADPLCLPKTLMRLRLEGMDEELLANLAFNRAQRFFHGND